jgi:branched-chain amino acid transport system permease protein
MIFIAPRFSPVLSSAGVSLARPTIGGLTFTTGESFYYLMVVIFAIAAALLWRWRKSSLGMIFAAIRTSETRASTLGIQVARWRVAAFAIAAGIAGIGGAFFASYNLTAYPAAFSTTTGLIWFAVVMTGGASSMGFMINAGLAVTLFPQLLNQYAPSWVANVLPVLFGLGAINLARNPLGAGRQFREQMHWLAQAAEAGYSRLEATVGRRHAPGVTGPPSDADIALVQSSESTFDNSQVSSKPLDVMQPPVQ